MKLPKRATVTAFLYYITKLGYSLLGAFAILAIIVFLSIPGHWIYQKYIGYVLGSLVNEYGFELTTAYLDFSYAIYGCLILVLAEVFKRRREAYQELKLTV